MLVGDGAGGVLEVRFDGEVVGGRVVLYVDRVEAQHDVQKVLEQQDLLLLWGEGFQGFLLAGVVAREGLVL